MPVTPEQRKGADGVCETVTKGGVRTNKDDSLNAETPPPGEEEQTPKKSKKGKKAKKAKKDESSGSGDTSRAESSEE